MRHVIQSHFRPSRRSSSSQCAHELLLERAFVDSSDVHLNSRQVLKVFAFFSLSLLLPLLLRLLLLVVRLLLLVVCTASSCRSAAVLRHCRRRRCCCCCCSFLHCCIRCILLSSSSSSSSSIIIPSINLMLSLSKHTQLISHFLPADSCLRHSKVLFPSQLTRQTHLYQPRRTHAMQSPSHRRFILRSRPRRRKQMRTRTRQVRGIHSTTTLNRDANHFAVVVG